jgi:hypothetical protein
MMPGMPQSLAAISGGTVGYPPKPTTAFGVKLRISLNAARVPAASIMPA